ncbi:MAG: hypothetical protein ACJAXW_001952 [Candidatus Azotimanducaceae bacterium]|jgi:hypothetical protein
MDKLLNIDDTEPCIIVRGTLYPSVTLSLFGVQYYVNGKRNACRIRLNAKHEVEISALC